MLICSVKRHPISFPAFGWTKVEITTKYTLEFISPLPSAVASPINTSDPVLPEAVLAYVIRLQSREACCKFLMNLHACFSIFPSHFCALSPTLQQFVLKSCPQDLYLLITYNHRRNLPQLVSIHPGVLIDFCAQGQMILPLLLQFSSGILQTLDTYTHIHAHR